LKTVPGTNLVDTLTTICRAADENTNFVASSSPISINLYPNGIAAEGRATEKSRLNQNSSFYHIES